MNKKYHKLEWIQKGGQLKLIRLSFQARLAYTPVNYLIFILPWSFKKVPFKEGLRYKSLNPIFGAGTL